MIKLFVDDERECPEGWTLARSAAEAYVYLQDVSEPVIALSLDHDLGLDPDGKPAENGYDIASWLEERQHLLGISPPAELFCHSSNPVGRANIEKCFSSMRKYS
jgi:hypothetical protein